MKCISNALIDKHGRRVVASHNKSFAFSGTSSGARPGGGTQAHGAAAAALRTQIRKCLSQVGRDLVRPRINRRQRHVPGSRSPIGNITINSNGSQPERSEPQGELGCSRGSFVFGCQQNPPPPTEVPKDLNLELVHVGCTNFGICTTLLKGVRTCCHRRLMFLPHGTVAEHVAMWLMAGAGWTAVDTTARSCACKQAAPESASTSTYGRRRQAVITQHLKTNFLAPVQLCCRAVDSSCHLRILHPSSLQEGPKGDSFCSLSLPSEGADKLNNG